MLEAHLISQLIIIFGRYWPTQCCHQSSFSSYLGWEKSISRSEADDIWKNPPWSSCQSLIFRRGVSSSWPSIGSTRVNTSRVFSSKLLFSTLAALEMKCKYLNYFSFYQVLVALKYLYLILYSMIIAPVQIHFCMKSQACNVITLCPFHLWYAATSYVSICFDVALFFKWKFYTTLKSGTFLNPCIKAWGWRCWR